MTTVGRHLALAAAAVMACAVAAGTVIAGATEDDLAVVKRAVRHDATVRVASDKPAADEPVVGTDEKDWERRGEGRRVANRDLKWFKVRVVDKGSKRSRVTINLPIALVRALDDFPIDIGGHGGWRDGREDRDGKYGRDGRGTIRLGDVLATLEGGQSLVEIDDDDATVRVWVE
jgi:hypothetical protein